MTNYASPVSRPAQDIHGPCLRVQTSLCGLPSSTARRTIHFGVPQLENSGSHHPSKHHRQPSTAPVDHHHHHQIASRAGFLPEPPARLKANSEHGMSSSLDGGYGEQEPRAKNSLSKNSPTNLPISRADLHCIGTAAAVEWRALVSHSSESALLLPFHSPQPGRDLQTALLSGPLTTSTASTTCSGEQDPSCSASKPIDTHLMRRQRRHRPPIDTIFVFALALPFPFLVLQADTSTTSLQASSLRARPCSRCNTRTLQRDPTLRTSGKFDALVSNVTRSHVARHKQRLTSTSRRKSSSAKKNHEISHGLSISRA